VSTHGGESERWGGALPRASVRRAAPAVLFVGPFTYYSKVQDVVRRTTIDVRPNAAHKEKGK